MDPKQLAGSWFQQNVLFEQDYCSYAVTNTCKAFGFTLSEPYYYDKSYPVGFSDNILFRSAKNHLPLIVFDFAMSGAGSFGVLMRLTNSFTPVHGLMQLKSI